MEVHTRNRNQPITRSRKIGQTILIVLAAAVVAAVIGFGANYLRAPSSADVERGVEAAKEMPLVGLVIAENPALEEKLRAVIADELKNPGQVPSPGSRFGVEVRQRYIIPTLLAADDDSALKATGGMEVLAKYLQTKDPALCRELGLAGLQNANKLDADGKVLLKQALALQEQAYRNGKAGSPKTPLKTEEIGRVLGEAGYTDKDLEQLSTFEKLSTVDGCAATVKLYGAPRALPTARGGTLSRWLLTVAQ
ncbi:MAG TPA: hypothetical protein VK634_05390 [Reyranella sp.]|nr:hypothetical protein [Reyranella sp.]